MFDFVSVETSTSGDAETFTFIFAIEGLLASLGHFDLYCTAREACVLDTHLQNVASCHESVIQLLHVYIVYFYNNFGPHARPAEAISVSAAKLNKIMFPLHVFHYPGCLYLSSLETRSLGTIVG